MKRRVIVLLKLVELNSNWSEIFASNVRRRRKALGLSQEEIAHRVGIDVRYLGGIERNQENPSLQVMVGIADALGTTPASLLTPEPE